MRPCSHWATVVARKVVAEPDQFGLQPGRAEAYADLTRRYTEAMRRLSNPNLRRRIDTLLKDELKVELARASRALVEAVKAWEGCDDEIRVALNIPLPTRGRRRVPPPTARPFVWVARHEPRGLVARFRAEGGGGGVGGMGRPADAVGTSVMTFVGEQPPSDPAAWAFRGNTGEMSMRLTFPASVPPGSRVWVQAVFFNRRFENGPFSRAICARIAGSGLAVAA